MITNYEWSPLDHADCSSPPLFLIVVHSSNLPTYYDHLMASKDLVLAQTDISHATGCSSHGWCSPSYINIRFDGPKKNGYILKQAQDFVVIVDAVLLEDLQKFLKKIFVKYDNHHVW